MNSALNCTRKPISHSSPRDSCDIGFRLQFNAEFTSQVINFHVEHASYIFLLTFLCVILKEKTKISRVVRKNKKIRVLVVGNSAYVVRTSLKMEGLYYHLLFSEL